MKLNNPLPQPLPKECEKAAKIFKSFVDSTNNGLDGVIPRNILENARGFAIFTIVKAGFVFSARAGSGIVIAKLGDGAWSAPSAIGTAGVGLGGQAGAEMTDFLVVLNSRAAITSFMAAGSLTLGGNMSLALGPLGRNGEASGALNTNGQVAAMYSYSKTRGLFGGISIEGSIIVERQDANALAYKSPVTARLLLGGTVEPPHWAIPLIKTIEGCTGMPGHREWINDEGSRTSRGTYAFGGPSNPGLMSRTPSFLRKKKKSETTLFPPESWGEETKGGSYFSLPASHSHSRNLTWDGNNPSPAGFGTQFESDFSLDRQPMSVGPKLTTPLSLDDSNLNSFTSSSSIAKTFTSADGRPSPLTVHQRTTSLENEYQPTNWRGNYLPSTSAQGKMLSSDIAFRPELVEPLLPLEVARAIALFDFNAVESGDLTFRKGDVITIIKKSDSIDDWWTGSIKGRQGIFPANFVEIA